MNDREIDNLARPDTFAGVLRNVVHWLDMTDPIVAEKHPEAVKGRNVQLDLEALATALDERPSLDARLMSLMVADDGHEHIWVRGCLQDNCTDCLMVCRICRQVDVSQED